MNWKKSLCIALLAGAALTAAAGCSGAGNATTTEQTTSTVQTSVYTQPTSTTAPSTVKPTSLPGGPMFQPPSGNVTGRVPTMNLADAAAKLGVTAQQLSDALGNIQQGMPDFAAIAQKLGVTEQALREALGFNSSNGTMPGGPGGAQPPTAPTTTSK
jgi:hypothetical protein